MDFMNVYLSEYLLNMKYHGRSIRPLVLERSTYKFYIAVMKYSPFSRNASQINTSFYYNWYLEFCIIQSSIEFCLHSAWKKLYLKKKKFYVVKMTISCFYSRPSMITAINRKRSGKKRTVYIIEFTSALNNLNRL